MVRLWDLESGAALQLEGHSDDVEAVTFSPNGKLLASGSRNGTIRLWDGRLGAWIHALYGNPGRVHTVVFSPDSRWLASASEYCTVRLWDLHMDTTPQMLLRHSGGVWAVTFSPDSKRLAAASSGTCKRWGVYKNSNVIDNPTIRIWGTESGTTLQTLEGHYGAVLAVAFSEDGKRLVSASEDKTVRLWDIESATALRTFGIHGDWIIHRLSFSTDDSYLNTTIGTIRLDEAHHPTSPMNLESRALFVFEDWVMLGSARLLWLPADHRATCVSVDGPRMALGHSSGRVSFWCFDIELLNGLGV
jgi:WD40 repeat protein